MLCEPCPNSRCTAAAGSFSLRRGAAWQKDKKPRQRPNIIFSIHGAAELLGRTARHGSCHPSFHRKILFFMSVPHVILLQNLEIQRLCCSNEVNQCQIDKTVTFCKSTHASLLVYADQGKLKKTVDGGRVRSLHCEVAAVYCRSAHPKSTGLNIRFESDRLMTIYPKCMLASDRITNMAKYHNQIFKYRKGL